MSSSLSLWILRPVEGLDKELSPWEPWYDKSFGFVVSAETEEQARQLVAEQSGGDETRRREGNPWLDASLSTCVPLEAGDEPRVIIEDYAAA